LEGFAPKMKAARLMFANARLRLTMPEAYRVHKDVIEWNAQFSEQRVPDQALGVDAATAKVMRFVMHSWERVRFFNRFLAGTWAPRIQMDFMPSLACGAHFVILARRPAASIDDYVAAGRALQRFWLTVTDLGLFMQPEMTPLIFSRYAREGLAFSTEPGKQEEALGLSAQFNQLIGAQNARNSVYMGRVGAGKAATSRSQRMPVEKLMR
ncbi:MAG: molybdopterin biosynthesis protein MoeY, partial [Janthinobacterium lividum]